MRILQISDVHAGLLPASEGLKCWARAVDIAIEREVDGVILCGDQFHHRHPRASAVLQFDAELRRLEAARIPVLAIAGNHEYQAADGPLVQALRRPGVQVSVVPEVLDLAGLTVATLPFTSRDQLMASRTDLSRDEATEEMTDLLVTVLQTHRAERPDVIVGHWTVGGAMNGSERDLSLLVGEPVIPTVELEGLGVVMWGHIHRAQGIFASGSEIGAYAGSIDRVSFGEEREAKVAIEWLMEGSDNLLHELPARRFLTVSLADCAERGEDLDVEGTIVRVKDEVGPDQLGDLQFDAIQTLLLAGGARSVRNEIRVVAPQERSSGDVAVESAGPLDGLEDFMDARGTPEEDRPRLAEMAKALVEEASC